MPKKNKQIGGGVAAPTPPQGKKTVPTGYKNYGQYRSEQVHTRNAARKAEKTYTRPKAKNPKVRYKAGQLTDSSLRDRTISRFNRLKAMGVTVPGVSQKDLDSGAGARRVKRALRYQRNKKKSLSIPPKPGPRNRLHGRI
jgi:hypothetical protein